MAGRWVMLLLLGTLACAQTQERKTGDFDSAAAEANAPGSVCKMPAQPTTILERDGAILETWEFRLEEVVTEALPEDSAFLAYRAAIERDGADVVRPVADPPIVRSDEEAEIWRNEHFNNDPVFSGAVGSIDPISCLDALLFSRQASRISQIDQPTEFLASVLRREASIGPDLVVVFGAGSEMFPPREVYGFEVVDRLLTEGWSYWSAIQNHTVQKNGDLLALGVPGLRARPTSTCIEVSLRRWASRLSGLQTASIRSAPWFTNYMDSESDNGALSNTALHLTVAFGARR